MSCTRVGACLAQPARAAQAVLLGALLGACAQAGQSAPSPRRPDWVVVTRVQISPTVPYRVWWPEGAGGPELRPVSDTSPTQGSPLAPGDHPVSLAVGRMSAPAGAWRVDIDTVPVGPRGWHDVRLATPRLSAVAAAGRASDDPELPPLLLPLLLEVGPTSVTAWLDPIPGYRRLATVRRGPDVLVPYEAAAGGPAARDARLYVYVHALAPSAPPWPVLGTRALGTRVPAPH